MQIPEPVLTESAGDALREYLLERRVDKALLLCDSNTATYCLPLLKHSELPVLVIPAGEAHKTFDTAFLIMDEFLRMGMDKNSLLINLGGGMVSDTGGFAASVYRRGIPYMNIPTTLLAMTDAAIGGKTGLDYRHLKNYIGTISQPEAVLIAPEFLNTLPQDELKSAWAEIIKTAVITDAFLFERILEQAPLEELIRLCAMAKNRLVQQDPLDSGPRQLLNFGHSIGHAFESSRLQQNRPEKHGFAVAKGLLMESDIALHLGMLRIGERDAVHMLVNQKTGCTALTNQEFKDLEAFLSRDKKNSGNGIVFSLPEGIGRGRTGIRLGLNELKDWKNQGII